MDEEDFKTDIKILMADEDVQFKLKKLKIDDLARFQVHILDWLLLKSPNLINLQISSLWRDIVKGGLEIKSELNIKKLQFRI